MIIGTNIGGVNGRPIQISDAQGMSAICTAASVGTFVLYTGTTTATYTNGAVYLCYNDSNSVY